MGWWFWTWDDVFSVCVSQYQPKICTILSAKMAKLSQAAGHDRLTICSKLLQAMPFEICWSTSGWSVSHSSPKKMNEHHWGLSAGVHDTIYTIYMLAWNYDAWFRNNYQTIANYSFFGNRQECQNISWHLQWAIDRQWPWNTINMPDFVTPTVHAHLLWRAQEFLATGSLCSTW